MSDLRIFEGKHYGKIEQTLKKLNIKFYEGSAEMQLPKILDEYGFCGRIALISGEQENLLTVKNLRGVLTDCGKTVSTFYLKEEEPLAKSFSELGKISEDVRLIVVIGGQEVINKVRYFAQMTGREVIVYPTDTLMEKILQPYVQERIDGKVVKMGAKTPFVVLIDPYVYKKCKKHRLADSFSAVVTKCLTLIDYKYSNAFTGKEVSAYCYNLVVEAINDVINVRQEHVLSENLLKANLKLSISRSLGDVCDFSVQEDVGYVLGLIDKDVSSEECQFVAFLRLIKLYKLFISNLYLHIFKTPSYTYRLEELSAIANLPIKKLTSKYKTYEFDDVKKGVSVLREDCKKLITEIDKTVEILPRLKDFKKFICNPKKPMNRFTPADYKKGIILGGYVGENHSILKLLTENGFTELID